MKTNRNIGISILRTLSVILVFAGCLISILMVLVCSTFSRNDFFIENIANEQTEQAVFSTLTSYLGEKSNQTNIPLDVFKAGYDEDTLCELIRLRAQDTADFITGGIAYPELYIDSRVDFEQPLVSYVTDYYAQKNESVPEDLLVEIRDIAYDSKVYVGNLTNVFGFSSYEDSKLFALLSEFLSSSWIIMLNIVLLTVAVAVLSWKYLYQGKFWDGGYTTTSALWMASAVIYCFAIVLRSLRLAERLPIVDSSPFYYVVYNLLSSFEQSLFTIASVFFFVLLVCVLFTAWKASAPFARINARRKA